MKKITKHFRLDICPENLILQIFVFLLLLTRKISDLLKSRPFLTTIF